MKQRLRDQRAVWMSELGQHVAADAVTDRLGSHTAEPSSRCIASGVACPARSASHQPFFRSTPESSPSTNSRAVRRGSTRENLRATSAIVSSNIARQPAGSMLWPAATAWSIRLSTTDDDLAVTAPGHVTTPS
jgi:hypothetical protein